MVLTTWLVCDSPFGLLSEIFVGCIDELLDSRIIFLLGIRL